MCTFLGEPSPSRTLDKRTGGGYERETVEVAVESAWGECVGEKSSVARTTEQPQRQCKDNYQTTTLLRVLEHRSRLGDMVTPFQHEVADPGRQDE